jgi:predicted dehydrogenase
MDAIRRCRRAELVAIADTSGQRLTEAADRFHVARQFDDYRELLLCDGVDAVSIALPNYLHAPVTIDALKAGKHVHLDKPFAMNARQAAVVIATAKKARRVLMVGQNQRFTRDAQMLKRFIERGALGEIYHARAWWIRRGGIPRIGSWFTQKKFAGGGALVDIGVHMLDLALHLMDSFKPVAVTGVTHAAFGPRGLGGGGWGLSEVDEKAVFDVEDYAAALIKLKGGQSLILEASWAAHVEDHGYGVHVYGTDGGGSVFPAKLYRRRRDNYEVIRPEHMKLKYPEDRLHHFVDCVLDGEKPLVSPAQSLAVQKILDAIYQSARTGREVRL